MELTKGIPVSFGALRGFVYGGPFREYRPTRRLVGVKMAAEIPMACEISIPTEDFSVPLVSDMQAGLSMAVLALNEGNDIYAGCMGGIGRTGLFMGCMAKLMADFQLALDPDASLDFVLADPVRYVRKHYKPYAIETQEQQDFVRNFPTEPTLEVLMDILTPKREVVYPSLFEYMSWWMSGGFLR